MTRRVVAIGVALALTLLSTFALQPLVLSQVWLARTLVCLAVVVVVLVIGRSRTSSASIPSLAALVVGLLSISALYFRDEGLLGFVPTGDTVDAVRSLIPATMAELRSSYPPIAESEGVGLMVTAGVLVVFLLVEMLAVGAWAPAWAGLPVLGLWCVPIMLGAQVPLPAFVLTAACYACLIAVQARDDARANRPPDARATRATAVVTIGTLVVALVAAPLLLRLPVPIRWHPFYELVGSSTTRLDLGIELRDDLTRTDDTALFEYTGASADEIGPLHAYTVTDFTGSEWVRGQQGDAVPNDGQLLFPTPAEEVEASDRRRVTMTIYDLGQDRVLLPDEPRVATLPDSSSYVADADELVATIGSEVTYYLTISPRSLDEQALASLSPATDVPAELLEVPDTGYESDIAELTRRIVDDAGAQNPYEQLLAIQNFLRDPALFRYSTTIPAPRTPDAVWDFLTDRQGYCVQFATAMIVMARSLGIPARLAVGFLPGRTSTDGVTQVTADQAHAWPQVLFDDVGWVRFEPTPGVQAGTPPEYAPEPVATGSAAPTEGEIPTVTADPTSSEPTTSTAAGGSGPDDRESSPSAWLVVLAALVLLATGVAAAMRRREQANPRDLEQRWAHVLAHLGRLGVEVASSQTPRSVVAGAVDLLDPDALDSLGKLARAVETASYDRVGAPRASEADVDAWVEDVLRSARERISDSTRERARV